VSAEANARNQRTIVAAIILAVFALGIWSTCSKAKAQQQHPPAEAPTVDATSVLNPHGQSADVGQVATDAGLGGVSTGASGSGDSLSGASSPVDPLERTGPPAPDTRAQTRNPFATNWLLMGYDFDSRDTIRDLSFEGHSSPIEGVDFYGDLDLYSSLDDDASRFELRSGIFWRAKPRVGLVFWYEDYTGSWNDVERIGGYYDPALGGDDPFCRLMLLPIASDTGGVMARVMGEFELRERWSVAGFIERDWRSEGDWTAANPELRYAIEPGKVYATLGYQEDTRWNEPRGVSVGLKAGL